MPNGVRVLLKPILGAAAHGQPVIAAQLGLTTLGAGPAELAKGETKPARLIFSGAFLKKARDEAKAPPAPKEFASIPGTIALSGKPLQAKLTLGGSVTYVKPAQKGNFRRIRLRFENGTVLGAPKDPVPPPPDTQPPAPHPLHFLTLPEEPAGSRFLVVSVALEIGGTVVAAIDANDMLDLPLPPIRLDVLKSDHQFAPSVESFSLSYSVGGLAGSSVTLEVSSPHYAGGALFKRVLTEAEIADGVHTLEWDGKCNTKSGDLAGQFLNPLFAPYTLKLSDGASHSKQTPVRVLYHSVKLEQGGFTPDDQEPPKADKKRWVQYKLNELGYYGGPVGHDFDDYLKKAVIRYKANHVKMHQVLHANYTDAISADLEAALAAGDNARAAVSGNAFDTATGKSKIFVEALTYEETAGGSEFGTPKAPKEKARLNRPLIPVLATPLLRDKKGKKVEAPAAVGPVRVDWLFVDVREDLKRQLASKGGEPSRTRDYVTAALKTKGGRTATTGDNCHEDFGGVRGANDYKSAFVVGTAYEPYDVKDDAGQKACFSLVITDSAKFPRRFGKAGVLFRPSFVAGDAYQLRADLDFSGRPNQKDLEKLHGVTSKSKRVSGRTGVFEIVRRAKVALQLTWPARKNDPQWERIRAEFAHAYIELDVTGISKQPISAFLTQKQYQDVVVTKTTHTDPTKISLLPNALVGVALPAQGGLNAAAYKVALNTFTNANYWDKINEDLRRQLTKNIRKVHPTGFVVIEFLTHLPVDIMNAPPGDVKVTKANKQFVTWTFSIGLPDSTVFADQKDPDKVYYVVSHEMGHNFWLLHWENSGGVASDHDTHDHNCSMSYSTSGGPPHQAPGKYTPHFCGKCILKLRGWDIDAAGLPAHS